MTTMIHPLVARTRRVNGTTRFALRCAMAALVIGAIPVIGFVGIAVALSGAFVGLVGVVLAVVYDEGLLEPFAGFWACHIAAVAVCVWQAIVLTWHGIHLLGIVAR